MKNLYEYFLEQNINSIETQLFESETSNNAERREELENWLKNKKLGDYVETLNQMLDDPKAAQLLKDGFGGELGDTKLKFNVVKVPVKNLRPTQSEIDVEKSVKFPLTKPENIDNYYKTGENDVIVKFPLITFRKNYIIDGHHRWSQVFAFNPEAKMVCCNYDGDISPVQMLKATQGTIAAVKADDSNKNNGKIPSSKVDGQDLFDDKWDKEAIIKYVKETAVDEVPKVFVKYHKELDNIDSIAEYVAENLMQLKSNNYPEDKGINRGIMPQTDKGGTDENDPKTSFPGEEGSALNKLKDDKFVGKAVK